MKPQSKPAKQWLEDPSSGPTKGRFLHAYEKHIQIIYGDDWAKDKARVTRFMSHVAMTIRSNANRVNLLDSPAAKAAWKEIGAKGRMTYNALRALPDNGDRI